MDSQFTKLIVFLTGALACALAFATESVDGKDYTNFGNDLRVPIFPKNGELNVYKNKTDATPSYTAKEERIELVGSDWKKCLFAPPGDPWVRCSIGATTGWVKRADFLSGGEYQPFTKWPFRYWLTIASSGMGGEETDLLIKAAKRSPYLVTPVEYDNIFFIVNFDQQGNAISPKTHKKTGDRVFVVGNAVYLAPDNAHARDSARWLFLNYYHLKLQAMCPAENPDSCFSAVNLSATWPGIHVLNTSPASQFAFNEERQRKEKKTWYGAQEVAFARHTDPVQPLLYTVPTDVHMRIEVDGLTDAQMKKNREKQFCLIDCSAKAGTDKK